MVVWALAVAVGLAVAASVVLFIFLRQAQRRAKATDALVVSARATLQEAVDEETERHVEEIRRVLSRERAEAASELAADERRLSEARRAEFAERERRAVDGLSETMAATERRLEDRLRDFSDDLERAQRHLEAQLAHLAQRQEQAIADVEARIRAEAEEIGSSSDEQRRAVTRLRDELERAATSAVTEALDELEAHTTERRRAIDEINERLRARESAIAEGIERAETDARGRLELALLEFERRQSERIERVVEREIDRHATLAAGAFDERMREIREEAAAQLARELDRAVELLSRDELARRLDGAV